MRVRRLANWGFIASVIALASCSGNPPSYTTLHNTSLLDDPRIAESSGLAASRQSPGVVWTHNDSGNPPVLFAVDGEGQVIGSSRLRGIRNIDWEDMAGFEYQGRSWLAVADIGDNNARRDSVAIHILPEPDVHGNADSDLAWSIHFRYLAGPRDAESIAVDVSEGAIYVMSKRLNPCELYRLPLRPENAGDVITAEPLGQVSSIPRPSPSDLLLDPVLGKWSSQPTGMDFSDDRRHAAIITYRGVFLFERRGNSSWAQALRSTPQFVPTRLRQAEAIAFSPGSQSIHISSEKLPAVFLTYGDAD